MYITQESDAMDASYKLSDGEEKSTVNVHTPKNGKHTLINFRQVFVIGVDIRLAFYKLSILGA